MISSAVCQVETPYCSPRTACFPLDANLGSIIIKELIMAVGAVLTYTIAQLMILLAKGLGKSILCMCIKWIQSHVLQLRLTRLHLLPDEPSEGFIIRIRNIRRAFMDAHSHQEQVSR